MNIFIIPSNYPTVEFPSKGIFYREQALALAELNPKIKIGVSTLGRSSFHITKNVTENLRLLWKYFHESSGIIRLTNNMHEFVCPTITWTWRVFEGNIKGIVRAHEKNFLRAKNEFGKIDLIHAHISHPAGYAAMVISKKYDVPYVITEHMGPFPFPYLINKNKLREELAAPMKGAAKIICVSPALEQSVNSYGFNNTVYIPNLVDEDKFSSIKTKNSTFTFFTLAAMVDEKGIPEMLRAISLSLKDNPEVIFRIAGDGAGIDVYKRFAEDEGIADNIAWLGQISRERAVEEYQRCDAFILPSRHESFGIVYVEALACGKPVIATRCGGPEVIVNKQNGILVPVADVVAIKKAIITMIKNIKNYKPSAIREDFMKRFSKRAVVKQIAKVYDNIIHDIDYLP